MCRYYYCDNKYGCCDWCYYSRGSGRQHSLTWLIFIVISAVSSNIDIYVRTYALLLLLFFASIKGKVFSLSLFFFSNGILYFMLYHYVCFGFVLGTFDRPTVSKSIYAPHTYTTDSCHNFIKSSWMLLFHLRIQWASWETNEEKWKTKEKTKQILQQVQMSDSKSSSKLSLTHCQEMCTTTYRITNDG